MANVPLRERRRRITIADVFLNNYQTLLFYLKHLLLRLGEKHTISVWNKALAINADDLLTQILSAGWHEIEKDSNKADVMEVLNKYISDLFGSPVENINNTAAKGLIEESLPIPQIRRYFRSLDYEKQISGYEGLHLFNHPTALLAENAINALGRQGELMMYDIENERIASRPRKPCSFTEFSSRAKTMLQSREGNWLNCLVDAEIIKETDTEIIFHVTQCDCARYFKEQHPAVGYLMNCSHDAYDAKTYNKKIQLQITSTIMEGGKLCDFRYYIHEQK